jgi:hypothetical protein
VLHDLDAAHATRNDVPVGDRADDDFGAPLPQLVCLVPLLVVERDDGVSVV